MIEFDLADLREWRRKHGISQEKFARIADLGVNTILKIEAGAKVTKPTYNKVVVAINDVEKKATQVVPVISRIPPAPATAEKSVASSSETGKPVVIEDKFQMTNLDLELINRVLRMTPREKLKILEMLIH